MPSLGLEQLAKQNIGAAGVTSLADNADGDRIRSSKPQGNQQLKEPKIDMSSVKQFLDSSGFQVRHELSTVRSSVVIASLKNLII